MKAAAGAELAIAALVIAVVVMLIVPVPRPLLDGLLALNIGDRGRAAHGGAVLAAAARVRVVPDAARRHDAVPGRARGLDDAADPRRCRRRRGRRMRSARRSSPANLVVGIVVFAVITIVQLIVVSRGAERVAEVSARFALDAMPGKQMAIDAELRAARSMPRPRACGAPSSSASRSSTARWTARCGSSRAMRSPRSSSSSST